ncbi:MAG: hypothetical protein ACJ8R9_02550 [Steroidobacteraceae bacterium]
MHNPLEQSNSQSPACSDRLRGLPPEMLPPYNWQEFQLRSQQRSAAGANAALNWRHMAAAAALLVIVCGIAVWERVGGNGQHAVAGNPISTGGAGDRMSAPGRVAGDVDALRELASTGAGGHAPRADGRTGEADGRKVGAEGRPTGVNALTPGAHAQTAGGETRTADADARTLGADAQTPGVDAQSVAADAQTREAALRSRAIESWLATLPREPAVVRVGTRAAVARLEDRIAQVDDLLTSVRLEGVPQGRLVALQQERFRLVGSLARVRYAEAVASESP